MNRITVATFLLIGAFLVTVGSGPQMPAALAAFTQASGATGQPIIEISKTCPSLRYLGRTATFEINVANRGDGPANNVTVTDVITGGIEFRSADNNGTRQGNNIVWHLGTMDAGETRTLKADFLCNKIGTIRNSASVTYCAELRDECELVVKGIPAILLECIDDPDPIEVNGNVTYLISVTNQGSAVGTNIVIKCKLPAEQDHVSSTGPTNATAAGKTITFAPLASLAPKAKVVYKVNVKGVGVGDVRFGVEMTSDQLTSPVTETESTHIYE